VAAHNKLAAQRVTYWNFINRQGYHPAIRDLLLPGWAKTRVQRRSGQFLLGP
jgi:hypothetical protein